MPTPTRPTPSTDIYSADIHLGLARQFGSGQAPVENTTTPVIKLSDEIVSFNWKSLVNKGFIVTFKVRDVAHSLLKEVIEGASDDDKYDNVLSYLRIGRQNNPDNQLMIKFRIRWDKGATTPWRHALVADIRARGLDNYDGTFAITAVDPISYYLNLGDASGQIFRGKIGGDNGVIKQVINQYVPPTIGGFSIKSVVDDTTDTEYNHQMMRQDPKTFIKSLIEWSSSLNSDKVSWLIQVGEISKDAANPSDGESKSTFNINVVKNSTDSVDGPNGEYISFKYGGKQSDILSWEFIGENDIAVVSNRLFSSSISAATGAVIERDVVDENTGNKFNPPLTDIRGFTKPNQVDKGATFIQPIPEFSSGQELGIDYRQYIDGRARQQYMDMLRGVMRLKVSVMGEPKLFDTSQLGLTLINIKWHSDNRDDPGESERFLTGPWILYGWEHVCTPKGSWKTNIFLNRLDYDSDAKPGFRQLDQLRNNNG